jgi:hypothetical protein
VLGAVTGWSILAQPAADPLDSLVRLRQQPGESVPDMLKHGPELLTSHLAPSVGGPVGILTARQPIKRAPPG